MNKYYLIYRHTLGIIEGYYIIAHENNYDTITGTILKIHDLHNIKSDYIRVGFTSIFNSYFATLVEDPMIIKELDKLVIFQ